MPDLDVSRAGGSTGALSRATQLANQRAANANHAASLLRRPPANKPVPRGGHQLPGGGEGLVLPKPLPPPPKMGPSKKPQWKLDANGNRVYGPTDPYAGIQGPGLPAGDSRRKPALGGMQDILPTLLDPANTPGANEPVLTDTKTGKSAPLPGDYNIQTGIGDLDSRAPTEVDRYLNLDTKGQGEVRKNLKETQGGGKVNKTVNQMLDDIKKDPLQDADRFLAGQDLANAFRDDTKARYFTNQDLTENPFLATLNDLSVWSTYRLKVSGWNAGKKKTGNAQLDDNGDGTYAGLVDNGSFSSVTSPSNLSPYLVTRDEHGLLQVVTADQWIQGKFAEMRHDPELAANMITALAMTSAYGSDSTANSQRTRIVTDADGNPVKAFVSAEDLSALKQLANQVAILQNQGDEVAIDDSIAELTAMAADVTSQEQANGDFGGGGGGGYGRGGYGGGGGGYGGGGGSGAVRYTDGTQLTALVGSIARQRMGRELTAEESAQFIAYYHGLEEQSSAAYYAGQSNTQLDPEGQAVAWVTSHFGQDSAAHQYGNLAATFMKMMSSSQFLPGVA